MENHELMSPAIELERYFTSPKWRGTGAITGLDEQDADFIDSILSGELSEGRSLTTIRVNREWLRESHEAWIHVIIYGDDPVDPPVFGGFAPYPRPGVLIWQNSD